MICPLCHLSSNKYQFSTNEFHGQYTKTNSIFKYYQCLDCQSIFPDISKINLKNYYSSTYRHQPHIIESILVKLNFLYLNLITKFLFKNKNISVLDIGCGSGDYLNQLPPNYKKTGIDIKIDNKKTNLIQADFLQYKFKAKFDLIIFSHSLEHMVNPTKAILKAKSLLKNNGKIIISLPVNDCYSFIINPAKAFHLDPPRHVFVPNSKYFKKMLSKHFSAVSSLFIPYEFPLDLFWSLINNQTKYLLTLFPLLKIIKPETKLFICHR